MPTQTTPRNTQKKIEKLDSQINALQQTLRKDHSKRDLLHEELSHTEKQIDEGVRALRSIQEHIESKQQKIAALQKQAENLHQSLITQQQLLMGHIRARYHMGADDPLRRLLQQDDPYQVSRMLTYYQYIIKARQHSIDAIDHTHKTLDTNQKLIHEEVAKKQQLHYQLIQHQQQLIANKHSQTLLMQSLNSAIHNEEQTLSHLLQSLMQQKIVQPSSNKHLTDLSHLRKKLPWPIQGAHQPIQKMNQGVMFLANEETPVTAISLGKVVFSDWLKGYGLLLIIDHGHGFMSVYAHNQSLFKRKGQIVHQNEEIACVGHSGGMKQNGLYFEIREQGKAVPPLEWLS